MENDPGLLLTIVYFLAALTVLVFVHEWGHYIVARIFGVKVETFSIGFGKEIFGWRDKKETHWKVGWIPLGGYVKFFGDSTAISNPGKYLKRIAPEDKDKCFHFKPVWQRFLIVAAGPAINIVFAIFIFIGLLYANGQTVIDPVIGKFNPPSAAQEAGLEIGDRIIGINGNDISTFSEIRPFVLENASVPMTVTIDRNGEILNFQVTPKPGTLKDMLGNDYASGVIGISPDPAHVSIERYGLGEAVVAGTKYTFGAFAGMVEFLGRALTGNVSRDEVGGPVKIAQITAQAATQGLPMFIYILGLISVNLGLVNLLPIPLLDGGHLMFYSIEAVKGRPISVKAQEMASMVGLAVVLGLLFILTWNDLNLPGLG